MLSSAHMLSKVRHQYKQSAAATNSIKSVLFQGGTVSTLFAQMTQEGNSSVVRVQGVIKTEGYQKLKTFLFYVAHLWIL